MVIIPVLQCDEDQTIYTLMVEQRRIADGLSLEEFAAGGVDSNTDNLKTVACQEIREELHLSISPKELISMSDFPIRVNPDFSDGRVFFFYFEKKISLSFLQNIEGRNSGRHGDHEFIKIRVRKMSEITNCVSPSALIGLKLLEKTCKKIF